MTATKIRKSTRKALSPAEQEARKVERAAKTAMLDGMAESFDLDEYGPRMVKAYDSLCKHYSEGNALLILAQAEEQGLKVRGLNDVGGYGHFQEAGRQVRSGQHASIFIWAPSGSSNADKSEDVKAEAGAATTTVRRYYRIAGLFHVTQTDKITK